MRIDVTLWYRLITKGVITPNCYDGNSTISSNVPTSPTPSHYVPYDTNHSDGLRQTDSGAFPPSSPSYPHYDDVNINRRKEKKQSPLISFRKHHLLRHLFLNFHLLVQRNQSQQAMINQQMVHQICWIKVSIIRKVHHHQSLRNQHGPVKRIQPLLLRLLLLHQKKLHRQLILHPIMKMTNHITLFHLRIAMQLNEILLKNSIDHHR